MRGREWIPKSERIVEIDWIIAGVLVEIRPAARKPRRVFADESSCRRVVVSGAVIIRSPP